jgi:CheY-like chemotaxis protein
MLSRSLREDIEIVIDMPEGLWPVIVDPAEFELALLNIGVNARDAMPNGGLFRVAARNRSFSPEEGGDDEIVGDYVQVTLSDTGTGMAADVLARAFEPFFTTKEVGVGSGLGLSQVYGFARQSGGTARITSDVGNGTEIALLLPRANQASVIPHHVAGDLSLPSAPTRILLVEDDTEVAQVTAELLRDLGCETVTVAEGRDALALLEDDPSIELVISDIVMPGGVSGIELARTLRERRPGLPVLLATGYSQYAEQVVADGFILVEKPYHRDALAASIRAAAERARGQPRTAGTVAQS